MMLPGIVLTKCKMSCEGFGKALSNLVLYIAQPALILSAYIRPFDREIVFNAVWIFVLAALAHTIFSFVAIFVFRKVPDGRRKVLTFATIFSNAAYMGIPLIVAVLGEEAAIYSSVYSIVFNLFLWSLGVYICTGDKASVSFKKVLLHPVTISSVIGVLFFLLPIDAYFPSLLKEGLDMLKGLVAPLSMLIIGLRLAQIDFRGLFKDKQMYIFLLLRLILLPSCVFFIMRILQLLSLPIDITVMTVILVSASTPAATATSMFAEKFDCDAPYAGKLVSASTILSVATMPLISLLLNI